jgi:protoporphyrinogen/coproporphyrinogen III oxidase
MPDIAVIGAGAAGLSAAWRLASAGARVTVLDRSPHPGGLLRTAMLSGAHVDVGVQLISSTHGAVFRLAESVGARGLLQRSPGHDALWRRGRAHGITYGSVASMATSGALPTTLKLKLAGRYLPFLKTRTHGLDANDPAGTGGAALDGESIGAWGRREVGDDFVELLVYPLLAAYYGVTPEQTTAPLYHALARVGMDVTVHAAAGGFGALVTAIVAALEARGCRFIGEADVRAIAPGAAGVRIELGGAGAANVAAEELNWDAVVIATPPPSAAALLRGTTGPDTDAAGAAPTEAAHSAGTAGTATPTLVDWLEGLAVRSTFTVAYRMDRRFPGNYFGLSFPRGEAPGDTVAALCIQSRKLRGLVPADEDALVAMPAPAVVASLGERDDDVIADTMLAALEKAVPGMGRRVLHAGVHRFADACVAFAPGHLRRIAQFDPALLPPRVALAGAYLVAPTVEGAVRSGERAADRLLQAMDGRPL